ncbi:MAG TPA: hypothetical protein PKA90_07740 [Ignavibacteria bacterium]|nr:hypothetical protein [Ignavibacteria bacterium]HMR40309.1 hypothetical protein [Ignavibacteria bacterium]
MKDLFGEDKLNEFLVSYTTGNPVFTVSNSFFERDNIIFLPNPLLPINTTEDEKTKDEKIINFLNYKDSKSQKFFPLNQFNAIISGDKAKFKELQDIEEKQKAINKDKNEEYKNKQPKYIEDLRTSVEISRETFSSKEGQLFSYAPYYLEEDLIDSKLSKYSETDTIIFIKVLDDDGFKNFDCENILKEVFNIGYGKKKSSGYGQFDVKGFDKFEGFDEPHDPNGFITLSNYLPSADDGIKSEVSFYDLNIKYGKLGEELALSENPFKKPIVFMTSGSCFKTDVEMEFYGRCTSHGEISELFPDTIQNGFSFSLRCKLNKD